MSIKKKKRPWVLYIRFIGLEGKGKILSETKIAVRKGQPPCEAEEADSVGFN